MSLPPGRLRGPSLLVLAAFLFAVMALCARLVAGRLSVGQVVCARFLIGLGVLAVFFPATGRRPRIPRPGMWAARGLLGGAAVYPYFVALERLTVGPAVLLNSSWPICAALFGLIFLGERLSSHLVTGLIATTLGAGLVIWSTVQDTAGLSLGWGACAGALSAIVSGGAVVTVRSLRTDTDASTVFLSFCLFGFLVGLPFALREWQPLDWDVLWPLLGVGLTSAAAQLLFTYAMAFVTAAAGGLTNQLTPAFSWVLGALLLGEPLHPLAVLGAMVCMGGVLWGTGWAPRWLVPAARPTP
jgi:drug/metabolite transporter (DMT)-like permease